ncbi:hypothetical protein VTO42DRAFT_5727 [Malbranchea cinnamomea]
MVEAGNPSESPIALSSSENKKLKIRLISLITLIGMAAQCRVGIYNRLQSERTQLNKVGIICFPVRYSEIDLSIPNKCERWPQELAKQRDS